MGLFQKKQSTEDADAAARLAVEVETVRAILRNYAPGMHLTFGAPTRCPHCGDYGFVQGVNRGEGISYNHCFGCQADWVISVKALRIAEAEPRAPSLGPPASTVKASPWFAQTLSVGVDPDLDRAERELASIEPSQSQSAGRSTDESLDQSADSMAIPSLRATPDVHDDPAARQAVAAIPVARRTPAAKPVPAGGASTEARPLDLPTPGGTSFPEPATPASPARSSGTASSGTASSEPTASEPTAPEEPTYSNIYDDDAPPPGYPSSASTPAESVAPAEPLEPAATAAPAPAPATPRREPPSTRRTDGPVLDAAMLAQLSRPGRVVEGAPPEAEPERALRVVVIEDNPFDLAVLEELVDFADPRVIELITAATREEGERIAASAEHDLILLDLDLPDSVGITTLLEWQHRAVSAAPVIILSGSDDPAVIREARALGAVHFIQKEQLAELANAGAVGAQRLERLLRTTVKRAATLPRPS